MWIVKATFIEILTVFDGPLKVRLSFSKKQGAFCCLIRRAQYRHFGKLDTGFNPLLDGLGHLFKNVFH